MPSENWHTDTPGVLTISGEVDIMTAHDLRGALAANPDICRIDCSGVTFVDTAGLDAIIDTAAARSIVLVHPSYVVARLLDLYDRHGLWQDRRPVGVLASATTRLGPLG